MSKLKAKMESQNSVKADMALAKAEALAKNNLAKYREAMALARQYEAQVDFLLGVQGDARKIDYAKMKKRSFGKVAANVVCSDWHLEERVDKSTVGGLNEYSPDIAATRIERLWQNAVMLIDKVSYLAKVDEVYLALLGDLITGYIHDELVESNYLSPTEAVLCVREHIHGGIAYIRKHTKLPIVVPCCYGNHGRTTPKIRHSTGYKNSYEWMLYRIMERDFRNDPTVTFRVSNGYLNYVDVKGHTVRFHHGNAIKYQDGIGGITVPVNKAVAQWNKSNRAALDVFGHWHTFLPHWPRWVSNASLIGYTPFSVQIKAEYQPPTQSLIVIDRERGVTMTLPIFVE